MKKKLYKNILSSIIIFSILLLTSTSIKERTLKSHDNNYPNSSSSPEDCKLNYWVENSSGYYKPYFQKKCNRTLSLDYALYYLNGELCYEGHLYFTPNSIFPSSGHYSKSPIKIVIKSEKWD